MGKAGNAIVKFITYLLAVLLVLGAVGALAVFVVRQEGVTFYAEHDGQRYYSGINTDSARLYAGDENAFSVSAILEAEEPFAYTVTVTANPEYNFDYSLDGAIYSFHGNDEARNDYSELFPVTKTDTGFSLALPENVSVLSIVGEKCGGNIDAAVQIEDVPYFLLTVTSGESFLVIPLRFGVRISDVGTDADIGIVFGNNYPHVYPYLVSVRNFASFVGEWTEGDRMSLINAEYVYYYMPSEEQAHVYVQLGLSVFDYLLDSTADYYLSEEESAYALALLGDLGK